MIIVVYTFQIYFCLKYCFHFEQSSQCFFEQYLIPQCSDINSGTRNTYFMWVMKTKCCNLYVRYCTPSVHFKLKHLPYFHISLTNETLIMTYKSLIAS